MSKPTVRVARASRRKTKRLTKEIEKLKRQKSTKAASAQERA